MTSRPKTAERHDRQRIPEGVRIDSPNVLRSFPLDVVMLI